MCTLMMVACVLLSFSLVFAIPSFSGAEGFGAEATGGRGGRVIYVTNLNTGGPNSLDSALRQPGSAYILFKISGIIPGS